MLTLDELLARNQALRHHALRTQFRSGLVVHWSKTLQETFKASQQWLAQPSFGRGRAAYDHSGDLASIEQGLAVLRARAAARRAAGAPYKALEAPALILPAPTPSEPPAALAPSPRRRKVADRIQIAAGGAIHLLDLPGGSTAQVIQRRVLRWLAEHGLTTDEVEIVNLGPHGGHDWRKVAASIVSEF